MWLLPVQGIAVSARKTLRTETLTDITFGSGGKRVLTDRTWQTQLWKSVNKYHFSTMGEALICRSRKSHVSSVILASSSNKFAVHLAIEV
jgi:hypothetical protein